MSTNTHSVNYHLHHIAPTSLALSMSLLSSLPAPECRKHLAVFSAATPIGALASYGILALLGGGSGGWTGIALLISVRITHKFSYQHITEFIRVVF